MLEKETAALRGHSAFISAYTVFFFNVVDVGDNVFLGKLLRIQMVVIGKDIADFSHIVADGHGGIGLGFQK